MSKNNYHLHLKGYVGGWDFDADYVDYILGKNQQEEVHVLIDSLGGSLAKALSIVSAFRNHGNVHVHYVGMNASAATIASLGAKHVSIDSSAMYLVHKCSMEFFQWASANSDKLSSIIEEAAQMKADLDKMDANVAEMYAAKCKRDPQDLLALMKKGGWLTAKEALDWGFVDEITSYEDDKAPVIDDRIAADLNSAGIPIPNNLPSSQPQNLIARFVESLTSFFKSNQPHNLSATLTQNQTPMTPDVTHIPDSPAASAQPAVASDPQTPSAQTPSPAPAGSSALPEATPETVTKAAYDAALAAKDSEIADLKAQIEALKGAPGATTTHVVDNTPKGDPTPAAEDPSSPEAFFNSCQRAQALYDMLPR